MVHVLVVYLVPIYAYGGTFGSGAASTARGSGGSCTFNIFCANDSHFADGGTIGSGAAYGRGILVDIRSSSGAHGSGHVGRQVQLLVIVQVMVRMVTEV